MIKCFSILLSILFLFLGQSFSQQEKLQQIDTYIQSAMKNWKMPGFAVGIIKNDTVIFSKGFGVREAGKSESVDENTLFVIASCSKAFTTASLAILVDQGKIKWDDPVIKYLPGFQMYDPWITKEITIRDLVTHRSGLETFSGDFLWLSSSYDRKEIIKRIQYLKPTTSFRTKYGYQNLMFITAAEIIKAVTDTVWGDFIRTHILEPAKMKHSNTSYTELAGTNNVAKPHFLKNGEFKIYSDTQKDNAYGALGINSCASDMVQWIRLQLNKGMINGKQVFSERQSSEMWLNQMTLGTGNYGLGWFISYRNGKRVLNHGGGMPGMISDVTLIPEDKFGFVILSNFESGMVSEIRNYLLDLFANVEPKDYRKLSMEGWQRRLDRFEKETKRREDTRVKDTKPSLALEKYCGTYEDKMYGKTEITMKDGQLYMQFLPTKTFRGKLLHWHYDTFYIDWEDEFLTRGWVKFDMDFDGIANKFTIEVPNSPDFIFTELLFEKTK